MPPVPRPDIRLQDAPMQPVDCARCGAALAVRKSSWDQTTLQWTSAALRQCHERRATRAPSERPNRNAFEGCSALRDAIRAAAVTGELEVQSGEPLPTNPAGQGTHR